MFNIGDFARLGRVSVRMLRHYDAIGLLPPAALDRASGYRYYNADQLRRLNRVIALKDLGFTLQQVQAILDDKVDVVELRGMLRLRRAQLEAQMTADELTAVAASYEGADIGPVIQPLYPALFGRLEAAGVTPVGPGIAYYEPAEGETREAVIVHAAVPVAVGPRSDYDFRSWTCLASRRPRPSSIVDQWTAWTRACRPWRAGSRRTGTARRDMRVRSIWTTARMNRRRASPSCRFPSSKADPGKSWILVRKGCYGSLF
jgi:DNA-binding transcriptional MerR regulator